MPRTPAAPRDDSAIAGRGVDFISGQQTGKLSMSKNHDLVQTMKLLGFDNDSIRAASDAVSVVESERLARIQASIAESGVISPMQAAAQGKRNAERLHRLDGELRNATRFAYRLPTDGSFVNIHEVDRAFDAA